MGGGKILVSHILQGQNFLEGQSFGVLAKIGDGGKKTLLPSKLLEGEGPSSPQLAPLYCHSWLEPGTIFLIFELNDFHMNNVLYLMDNH